jgi:hypothetical protein
MIAQGKHQYILHLRFTNPFVLVILQMRLYALYFLNKKVLVLMVVGFLIASALSATVMGTVLSGITGQNNDDF